MKIAMYSHDGVGLGHVRRNLNIANRFVQDHPRSSALLIAGNSAPPDFEFSRGVDLVKLPSIRKVSAGNWEARRLNIDCEALRDLRSGLILRAIESLEPDVFLVDYLPSGFEDELLPALDHLRSRRPSTAVILGLRDILDSPYATKALWRRMCSFSVVAEYYDRVFVYGHKDIFDSAGHYGFTRHWPEKIEYVGHVVTDAPRRDRDAARGRLGLAPAERLILVTAGGGADALAMMDRCVEAVAAMPDRQGLKVLMVTGPLMDPRDREALRALADGLPVEVIAYAEDMAGAMAAADVIVTMAGYNTTMEAVRCRKPVIAIPRTGPSAEQSMRATIFAGLGLIRSCTLDSTPAPLLASHIAEALADTVPPVLDLTFQGVGRVARRIAELARAGASGPALAVVHNRSFAATSQEAHRAPARRATAVPID